jgi:rSAM/selenodomain-associated transferase 1
LSVRILVFARAPRPGACKTRLIPALGAVGAVRLHQRLTQRTLRTAAAAGADVELWGAPDAAHGFFRACRRASGVRVQRQPAGDLGRRMGLALARALRTGAVAAILVGTDCPALSATDLRRARDALRTRDAVLQPSGDGGYVLIGMRRAERRALAGIQWSSGRELAQTRRRFARLGLSWSELPARADLDTPADYRRARRQRLI